MGVENRGKMEMDRIEKEYHDKWKQEAALVPESTRQEIFNMKKSGKSSREIAADLNLSVTQVSIIVIEAFAKERGEAPVYTV